jgi:hypothetical protein
VIFTLRTGSIHFSRRLVTPWKQGGYLPEGMHVEEGWVWQGSVSVETPEEADFFRAIGMRWIRLEER